MSGYGEIVPDRIYPVPTLQKLTGLGDRAIRLARQREDRPLKVLFLHKRRFVLGRHFIEYCEAHGEIEPPTTGKRDEHPTAVGKRDKPPPDAGTMTARMRR